MLIADSTSFACFSISISTRFRIRCRPYAISLAQENQARPVPCFTVLPAPKLRGRRQGRESFPLPKRCTAGDIGSPRRGTAPRLEPMVNHGAPGREILATASRCGADLIVLGVRGHADGESGDWNGAGYSVRRGCTCAMSGAHGSRVGVFHPSGHPGTRRGFVMIK